MVRVAGVRFQNAGKLYYFDAGEIWPLPGDHVIVESERGLEVGEVITGVKESSDDSLAEQLWPIVRVATEADMQRDQENQAISGHAFDVCRQKIAEHELAMKLISAQLMFDRSKVLFNFSADGRVDFRALVRDLSSTLHMRVELHQVGPRDEAKVIGGLGICGRPICCSDFLGDFQSVTIKMAKEQGLSLNPSKISGICGRLMCCLKYEEETYEQEHKRLPRVNRQVTTPDGVGTVVDVNIVRETVKVRVPRGEHFDIRDYRVDELIPSEPAQAAPAEQPPAEQPLPKPVERTNRPEGGRRADHGQPRRERRAEGEERPARSAGKPAPAKAAPKPAPKPAPKEEEQPKPAAPKPADAWKEALARAKKQAHMDDKT